MDPDDRRRLLDRLKEMTRRHPDIAGRDVLDVPYSTFAWRARAQR
ncbi:MAG: hypothetical protein M0Z87_00290 [Actinomycetota bacterium]|nr:hypothetical protein [Actinomycetota bacterium]